MQNFYLPLKSNFQSHPTENVSNNEEGAAVFLLG